MYFACKSYRSICQCGFVMLLLVALLSFGLNARIVNASARIRPANLSITSLLGIDDLAHKTLDQIDQILHDNTRQIQAALTTELNNLHTQISDIIGQLESTYKDLLNISFDRLDASVQAIATDLANQLDDINNKINQDIDHAQSALITVIQAARNQIGQTMAQFENSVKDIVVLVTQSAVYILDRAAWNAIGVGAVLLLLLGLLIIPVVIIIEKGWPSGAGGIIAGVLVLLFVVVGALLAFVPTAKAQALKGIGKGQDVPTIPPQPQIFYVVPNPVILGQTGEININGVHLELDGTATPVVTINGGNTAIHAGGDNQIVVGAPATGTNSTVQLRLAYNNGTQSVGVPLGLVVPTLVPTPALIKLSNFSVTPANPIANVSIVTAKVTVTNTGGTTSQAFDVSWLTQPGGTTKVVQVPALSPNLTQQVTFPSNTYSSAGTFQTDVHSNSSQMGSNPADLYSQVVVQAPTATPSPTPLPTTTFVKPQVYHGGNAFGGSGDDTLNNGDSAGAGCTITSVFLQLLDNHYNVVSGTTVEPFTEATAGDVSHWTGKITNDPRGTSDYTTTVHWSYATGVADRYQIEYLVTGANCNAPSGRVQ